LGWISRAMLGLVLAGASAAATAGVAAAQTAAPAGRAGPVQTAGPAHKSKSATVVQKRIRHGFGKILVTDKAGHALYYLPHGSCTAAGGCLGVWPRLVMPGGKTIPKGASCLGTARFGSHHRLQVSYHGKRLYTFAFDHGHSVTGNGDMGFKVAKVVRCRR
jgi:hypothetical protein